ncbi:glycerol dehydratase reactivase beta/small subunit family protein [Anaeroselena agilis]|uniref:Glycerol dehydratase reactivase beta/small subunit family protein n=1 Tax=Anaeroselena agilis TaxID=3063788 RepID=A0ABU3NS86_9FIRM|nr:glycerol dehydratase reactivase beta/small subunit family protein [Selenomonadales bacterium 4137-cl]
MVTENAAVKPNIVIYVNAHFGQEAKLREVQAGIEEEGVPSSWSVGAGDAASLACRGAAESPLGVGVGIGAEAISVHYHKLPADKPLFVLPAGEPGTWRRLGSNAARMVKGTPFRDLAAKETDSGDDDPRRRLTDVVMEIIRERLDGHGR